ncbi:adenylosuccinate lyase [Sarotherodon galilaeus]
MDILRRGWLILLPLCVCADSRVTLVKTTGKGPDITPVCTSQNLALVLVRCWISTERHTGETCCLLYRREQPLKCACDSRFTLIDVNRTIFLHLTSLTTADSGNYTCECSYDRETQVLSLNITVELEDDAFSGMTFMATVVIISAVATLIIAAGITCCVTLRRNPPRENQSGPSNLTRSETLQTLDEVDPYMSLQHPTSDVYQTISSGRPQHDANSSPASCDATVMYINTQGIDGKELHVDYAIYETIKY